MAVGNYSVGLGAFLHTSLVFFLKLLEVDTPSDYQQISLK